MKHFNQSERMSISSFGLAESKVPPTLCRETTHCVMAEGGRDRLFLQHPPQCLLLLPVSLIDNHTLRQKSGKQKPNVNLVFIHQKLYAFILKYALHCKFLHLVFGVQRKHSSMS